MRKADAIKAAQAEGGVATMGPAQRASGRRRPAPETLPEPTILPATDVANMPDDDSPLTTEERELRAKIEEKIQKAIDTGHKSMKAIAEGLGEIAAKKLSRDYEGGHAAYVKDQWGFSPAQASRIMSANREITALIASGAKNVPTNESQTRPLRTLSTTEEKSAVMDRAAEIAKERGLEAPTAKIVEEAIAEKKAEAAPAGNQAPVSVLSWQEMMVATKNGDEYKVVKTPVLDTAGNVAGKPQFAVYVNDSPAGIYKSFQAGIDRCEKIAQGGPIEEDEVGAGDADSTPTEGAESGSDGDGDEWARAQTENVTEPYVDPDGPVTDPFDDEQAPQDDDNSF